MFDYVDAPKYGALAKLYFGEQCSEVKDGTEIHLPNDFSSYNFFSFNYYNFECVNQGDREQEEPIRVEYHKFEGNAFCIGIAFVPKEVGLDEDDGWIITYVHNEDTGISQVGLFCDAYKLIYLWSET